MDVTREDLANLDEIVKALNKLRFDLSGTECMRMATSLAWLGQHRQRIDADCRAAEAKEKGRLDAALRAYDDAQRASVAAPAVVAPAPEAATPPPAVAEFDDPPPRLPRRRK